MIDAEKLLDGLTDDLQPLKDLVSRHNPQQFRQDQHSVSFAYRGKLGAHAITLFEPYSESEITQYCDERAFDIPVEYKNILRRTNGAEAFGLTLFGISRASPPDTSYYLEYQSPPSPTNVVGQNLSSIRRFHRLIGADIFYLGYGMPMTNRVGYFLEEGGVVRSMKAPGKLLGVWSSISEFLAHELRRNEKSYIEHEDEWQRWHWNNPTM